MFNKKLIENNNNDILVDQESEIDIFWSSIEKEYIEGYGYDKLQDEVDKLNIDDIKQLLSSVHENEK